VLILARTLAEIQLANDTQLPNSTTRNVRRNILTQRGHHFDCTRSMLENRGFIHSSEPMAVPFEKMSSAEKALVDRANRERNDQRSNDAPQRKIQIVETAKN
jgi:hypothetical protein